MRFKDNRRLSEHNKIDGFEPWWFIQEQLFWYLLAPYAQHRKLFHLCDLSAYSDEAIKGGVILRVGLLLLKYIFRDDLEEHLAGILALLRGLTEQATGLEYLETVLRYLALGTDKVTKERLQQAMETAFAERGSAGMRTLAEQWVEQGIHQAIALSDVVVGCYNTAVLEGLLQLKPLMFLNTRRWGDYFEFQAIEAAHGFFAEGPEVAPECVRAVLQTPRETLERLRDYFWGDPTRDGGKWVVGQVERLLQHELDMHRGRCP